MSAREPDREGEGAGGLRWRGVVSSFERTADLLEIHEGTAARGDDLREAARAIREALSRADSAEAAPVLRELRRVKRSLAAVARELVEKGTSEAYDALRGGIPRGLEELLRITDLDGERLGILHRRLGVDGPEDLEALCRTERLAGEPGFGPGWRERLVRWAALLKEARHRRPMLGMRPLAEGIRDRVSGLPGVGRVEIAGEIRRLRESVTGVVVVAATTDPRGTLRALHRWAPVRELRALCGVPAGRAAATGLPMPVRAAARSPGGDAFEVYLTTEIAFPCTRLAATGSPRHWERLREEARAAGLELDAGGLRRGDEAVPCASEQAVYAVLGLAWIPPELRERGDEIAWARRGELPDLVTAGDLRGLFHIHTMASDGRERVEEMAGHALDLGYEYVGIADHSASSAGAGGLSPAALRREIEAIRRLEGRFGAFRIFAGVECDVLPDGSLDYDDALLEGLDFVIAAVHTWDEQPAEVMTERVLRAIRHPKVRFLAHPEGRMFGVDPGYPIHMERVLAEAGRSGVWVELDANPRRLDLDWRWGRTARRHGVRIAVSPDAHGVSDLGWLAFGVAAARKAGYQAKDVVNAAPLEAMEALLRAGRGRSLLRAREGH